MVLLEFGLPLPGLFAHVHILSGCLWLIQIRHDYADGRVAQIEGRTGQSTAIWGISSRLSWTQLTWLSWPQQISCWVSCRRRWVAAAGRFQETEICPRYSRSTCGWSAGQLEPRNSIIVAYRNGDKEYWFDNLLCYCLNEKQNKFTSQKMKWKFECHYLWKEKY